MRFRLGGALAGIALAALLLSALPGIASTHSVQAPSSSAASAVNVVMKDRSFKASVQSVSSGKVTFVVRNAGTMKHGFLVLRTDRHHHLLAMSGRQASEVGAKGRIVEFAPGQTRRLTLTLAPGKYVLLCNHPDHYKRGLFAAFVVTRVASAPKTTRVSVSAFEMGFKLSKTTVPHGTVVFDVRNDGKLPHDFSFGSRGGGSPMLQAGQSATFTVKFATPGKYTFICTVEGHQEAGMIGVLTVT